MYPDQHLRLSENLLPLENAGVPHPVLTHAMHMSHDQSPAEWMIESELISNDYYVHCLARYLGCPELGYIDPHRLRVTSGIAPGPVIRRASHSQTVDGTTLITSEVPDLSALQRLCARSEEVQNRLAATSRYILRSLLTQRYTTALGRHASCNLHRLAPHHSASRVLTTGQAASLACLLVIIICALYVDWSFLVVGLDILFSLTFISVSLIRLEAAKALGRTKATDKPADFAIPDHLCPIYTVLVPLYREANMVPQIVQAMEALDYPKTRLDIKFLIENDDIETQDALREAHLSPTFEIIVVASHGPKTKPKALNVGLQLARGDYLVVYDAEDIPDPRQLRKALTLFKQQGKNLACLQACLDIRNSGSCWLARQFSIEYAALFHGLLPDLSRSHMPLPLGGTSNHFRRDILEEAGGWDPHNVTEDADLGIRLHRLGYRCQAFSSSTSEEAPTELKPWLKQRARWFKGWMQTWLVHMRNPTRTIKDMGLGGFIIFQIMIGGMLLAAFIHPAFLITLGFVLADLPMILAGKNLFGLSLLLLNAFNLLAGYAAAMWLAYRALKSIGKEQDIRSIPTMPIYWILMSLGAYLALWDLIIRPHHWHKTPHKGSSSP